MKSTSSGFANNIYLGIFSKHYTSMTANFRILFKLHIDFGSASWMDFFNLWLIQSNTFCSYVTFYLNLNLEHWQTLFRQHRASRRVRYFTDLKSLAMYKRDTPFTLTLRDWQLKSLLYNLLTPIIESKAILNCNLAYSYIIFYPSIFRSTCRSV